MSKKIGHPQQHYFLILQLLLLAVLMLAISQLENFLSPTVVTIGALGYFVSNTTHAHFNGNLNSKRVVEYGLIALICEFLMLNYVI